MKVPQLKGDNLIEKLTVFTEHVSAPSWFGKTTVYWNNQLHINIKCWHKYQKQSIYENVYNWKGDNQIENWPLYSLFLDPGADQQQHIDRKLFPED